jgi:hypothetical protein
MPGPGRGCAPHPGPLATPLAEGGGEGACRSAGPDQRAVMLLDCSARTRPPAGHNRRSCVGGSWRVTGPGLPARGLAARAHGTAAPFAVCRTAGLPARGLTARAHGTAVVRAARTGGGPCGGVRLRVARRRRLRTAKPRLVRVYAHGWSTRGTRRGGGGGAARARAGWSRVRPGSPRGRVARFGARREARGAARPPSRNWQTLGLGAAPSVALALPPCNAEVEVMICSILARHSK